MSINKNFTVILSFLMATVLLSIVIPNAQVTPEKTYVPVTYDIAQNEQYCYQNSTNGEQYEFQAGDLNRIRIHNHTMLQFNQSTQTCFNKTITNPDGPIQNQTRFMNTTMFHNFTNSETHNGSENYCNNNDKT